MNNNINNASCSFKAIGAYIYSEARKPADISKQDGM